MSSVVVVSENGLGRYQQAVQAGQHALIADEPVSVGGADAGPAPFEFIMSGLGACTSMTLRMYAERKGWELGTVRIALSLARDEAGAETIAREISVSSPLTDEQRARLLEIAGKTPVTKTLLKGVAIDSRFA